MKENAVLDLTPTEETYRLYVPLARPDGVVNWHVCAPDPAWGIMVLKLKDLQYHTLPVLFVSETIG